jgi:PAS domain S-box-containing protein
MNESNAASNHAGDLRKRAEAKVCADEDRTRNTLPPEETRQLLHELHVHEIELEMQNEELRRAQAELEASRARYFDLYDLAPVGYFTLSEKGLILEANLTAATLFGMARGDLVDQPLSRFVFPEDQDIYYLHRRQLFETGTPQVCEVRMLRADKAQFWARLQATAASDADGAPICRAVVNDITERKRAEQALQASQQAKYEQVVSMISDVVWSYEVDGQGHFVDGYISPVADRLLDLPAGTIGNSFDKYFSCVFPEELPAVQEMLFSGLRALAKDTTAEYRLRRHDGTTLWVCSKGSAYLQPNGHIVGFGTTSDISERKRTERQLQNDAAELEATNKSLEKANRLAECANRAKSEFLANMSHEIRTPMTAILGYADLLLDENVGRAREYVSVIKRNGEHLMGLISDILDLSKIEAGKLQIEPTRCSPVQVLAEVVFLMRPQAAAKQLKLKTELANSIPETVLTDPLRLRQVLVNLVGNAIKFTDQGEVRVVVRLNADRGRPSLCFDVADTGIGMNEEQVGKLFKPFSQVDNSSTRRFGGSGLGLCISMHLAESLGGGIEVRSEPGKGSTFSVTIDPGPLEGVQMTYHAQTPLLDRLSSTPAGIPDKISLHGRILLAEDVIESRQLITLMLTKAGADVIAVENGQIAVEDALAACEAGKPFDVILMDMQMPVLDGYEATRQLRTRGYTGPIVALTAHAMVEDCQRCLAAGCDDYLPKPCQYSTLLEMVARHITAEKVGKPLMPIYAPSSVNIASNT